MSDRLDKLKAARLYGIVDYGYLEGRDPVALARQMVAGGVEIVQLRAKKLHSTQLARAASRVGEVVQEAGALFIVNDNVQVAAESKADGVHVGQDDQTVADARRSLAAGQLVGKSTHSLQQALDAVAEGPDYIGVGPLYATPTKPDYIPVGLPLIREVREQLADNFPQFCIGGVNAERLDEILAAGAQRIVMVSAILQAPDIAAFCQGIRERLERCP